MKRSDKAILNTSLVGQCKDNLSVVSLIFLGVNNCQAEVTDRGEESTRVGRTG